jgi:hypothetical protein
MFNPWEFGGPPGTFSIMSQAFNAVGVEALDTASKGSRGNIQKRQHIVVGAPLEQQKEGQQPLASAFIGDILLSCFDLNQ